MAWAGVCIDNCFHDYILPIYSIPTNSSSRSGGISFEENGLQWLEWYQDMQLKADEWFAIHSSEKGHGRFACASCRRSLLVDAIRCVCDFAHPFSHARDIVCVSGGCH